MSKSVLYRAALAAFGSIIMAGTVQASPSAWWSPYTTDANTIGLWHFNDVTGSTGSFADSSVNGNNGTLNGNAGTVAGLTLTVPTASGAGTGPGTGLFGTALQYDTSKNAAVAAAGADTQTPFDWGQVSNSGGGLNYTNAVTIEAWIKPTAGDLAGGGRLSYIAGSEVSTGWDFGIQNGTLFFDNISTALGYHYTQQSGVTLVADTWAHVAGVLSNDGTNTTDTIYINGAQVATSSWAAASLPAAGPYLNIGENGANQKYTMFRSQIDEVRLSNVARTFGAAPVPEPASLSLLALGGLALLRRRGRVV